jgi:hypothetical protein
MLSWLGTSRPVDNVLHINVTNLVTGSRHLAAVIRGSDCCECGCGGHCTTHAAFCVLAHQLQGLTDGSVPLERHDGTPMETSSLDPSLVPGRDLDCSAAVLLIKGDMAEFVKSHGLSSWGRFHGCCPLCDVCRDSMVVSVAGVGYGCMPMPERDEDAYEVECQRCEKHLLIDSEDLRRRVLAKLTYTIRGKSARGRVLMSAIPGVPDLKRLDRLEPSKDLINPCLFEMSALPFRATFWTSFQDGRGRKF